MNSDLVTLVQPPIQDYYLTHKRTMPYGLASIAAALQNEGFKARIIDGLATSKSKPMARPDVFSYLDTCYPQKDVSRFSLFHTYRHFGYSHQHIAAQIRELNPFIVGISSLFTAYADQVHAVARQIKKFCPKVPVVVGGHHPTMFPESLLENPDIDYVLRGEAEQSMPFLCRTLRSAGDLKKVPGLAFRTTDQFYISAPAWIDDLKSLPTPAFDLINHGFYTRKKSGSGIVVSSRGCPMLCSYCAVSATSCHAAYRLRPVALVIKEIETQLEARNIGFLDFEDENLCLNKKWFTRLFTALTPLLENRGIELRAMNGLFPGSLDEAAVKLLKQAGFKTLNLSVGSTSGEQLKRFKRPDIRTDYINALALAQKYDLNAVSYLIAAAPGQTAQSTLDDLIRLAGLRTLIGLSVYYPAPGSLDYDRCAVEQLLPDDFRRYRSSALPLDHTTRRLASATLLRLSRIINFLKQIVDTHGHLDLGDLNRESQSQAHRTDREQLSIQLLHHALKTGGIPGVTPDGTVFEHQVDKALMNHFIEAIKAVPVSGIKGRHTALLRI